CPSPRAKGPAPPLALGAARREAPPQPAQPPQPPKERASDVRESERALVRASAAESIGSSALPPSRPCRARRPAALRTRRLRTIRSRARPPPSIHRPAERRRKESPAPTLANARARPSRALRDPPAE